jgi:sugar/nucleoside kinase (ribokinase family)
MLHLEGYALYRPEVAEAAVASARAAGALVSLDLASFELVRFLRADVLRFLAWVDLVFCNEDEAAVLVGAEEYVGAEGGVPDDVVANAVAFLRDHCAPGAVVTVSRGRQGCVTAGGAGAGAPVAVPANRVQAKDTTGAGDLFTSGFLSAYLAGEPLDVCARTGCFMGAQVVQVLGAELPPEAWGAVRDALPYFTAEHRPEITTTTATTTFSPVAAKQHTSAVTGEVAC